MNYWDKDLTNAVENRDEYAVCQIYAQGYPVNSLIRHPLHKHMYSQPPIIFSELNMRQAILEYVGQGGDINVRNSRTGDTAVLQMAADGNFQMLQWLINNDGDVTLKNHSGLGALHLAIQNGHLKLVKFLVIVVNQKIDASMIKIAQTEFDKQSKCKDADLYAKILQFLYNNWTKDSSKERQLASIPKRSFNSTPPPIRLHKSEARQFQTKQNYNPRSTNKTVWFVKQRFPKLVNFRLSSYGRRVLNKSVDLEIANKSDEIMNKMKIRNSDTPDLNRFRSRSPPPQKILIVPRIGQKMRIEF